MSNAPRTPTRNQLASIVGNDPRSVRALEQLFTQVSGVIPDELQATKEVAEYAQTEAAQAYTSANEALGASVRTSDAATSAQLEAAQAYRAANEALGASVRAVDAVTAAQLEAAQAYRAANEALSFVQTLADGLKKAAAAPIGYGSGSGGLVTQSTSKSTSVTLNRPAGRIVTANDALAANTSVSFVLNNSQITTEDCLVCCIVGFTNYSVAVQNVSTGQAVITVTNITASPLSDEIQINFVLIKGAFD